MTGCARICANKITLRELTTSRSTTLNRTINTSFTTFLATLPLALVASGAVQEFAIVILFGIVIGTSSSIFIAAPILLFLGENKLRRGVKPKLVADARP
jgi:preprotein translocase subunit SecF